MAGKIKGITIELNADTSKFRNALREANDKAKDLDAELRKVNSALKFNPTNVELLRQKQELLTEKVKDTTDKLKLLKDEQKRLDASGVEKNTAEYRALQREIITTESKAKSFENQLRQIGNVNLKAAQEQLKQIGSGLTNAGQALAPVSKAAAAATGSLIAAAVSAGRTADDLNTLSKVTGISTERLQIYSAAADLVDVSVEQIAKSQKKLTQNMSSAVKGSKAQTEAFAKVGVQIQTVDGSLRDADEVFTDIIAALGQMEEGADRDALAMEIFGKSATELNPLIADAGATYKQVADTFAKYNIDPIDQKTLDKTNEFNDQLDILKTVGGQAVATFGAKVAEALLPALETLVEWAGKLAQWVATLDPEIVQLVAILGAVLAVLSPLLIMLGALATAAGALNIAMLPFTGIVLGIIAAIALLVYAGVELAKNWDDIKQSAAAVWAGIKEAFENIKQKIVDTWENIKKKTSEAWETIKEKITKPFKDAWEFISGVVEKIKGFFPIDIKNLLSKIKLPHFSLTGSFSLVPPSIPKLSVDWYDKGGIFDSPSIIGVGEKRPEFVGALDDLREIVRDEAGNRIGNVTINVYASEGMSVPELVDAIDERLAQIMRQKEAAYGNI